MSDRIATITRDTLETQISVAVNLDGTGKTSFETGIPFLEHMLDQIARHGLVDLEIKASGDLHIDDHHCVEDIGISLGQAYSQALGDKKRYYALRACLCSVGRGIITCRDRFLRSTRDRISS